MTKTFLVVRQSRRPVFVQYIQHISIYTLFIYIYHTKQYLILIIHLNGKEQKPTLTQFLKKANN